MAEPVPCKTTTFNDISFTLWDRWILEGDLTVQEVGAGGWGGGGRGGERIIRAGMCTACRVCLVLRPAPDLAGQCAQGSLCSRYP